MSEVLDWSGGQLEPVLSLKVSNPATAPIQRDDQPLLSIYGNNQPWQECPGMQYEAGLQSGSELLRIIAFIESNSHNSRVELEMISQNVCKR